MYKDYYKSNEYIKDKIVRAIAEIEYSDEHANCDLCDHKELCDRLYPIHNKDGMAACAEVVRHLAIEIVKELLH